MQSDQDQDIPDISEWLVSDDDETVDELELDCAYAAVLLEDELEIDVAL